MMSENHSAGKYLPDLNNVCKKCGKNYEARIISAILDLAAAEYLDSLMQFQGVVKLQ